MRRDLIEDPYLPEEGMEDLPEFDSPEPSAGECPQHGAVPVTTLDGPLAGTAAVLCGNCGLVELPPIEPEDEALSAEMARLNDWCPPRGLARPPVAV